MNDINRVYLIGRLTADPELKTIPGGSQVCSFSVANNRSFTRQGGEAVEEVSYFNCTAWGKQGEILTRYAGKGKQVAIEGRLRQRRWQSNDGKNQSAVEIVVENFQFLGGRREEGGAGPDTGAGSYGNGQSSTYGSGGDSYGTRPQGRPAPAPSSGSQGGHGYDAGYDATEEDIPF